MNSTQQQRDLPFENQGMLLLQHVVVRGAQSPAGSGRFEEYTNMVVGRAAERAREMLGAATDLRAVGGFLVPGHVDG